MNLPRHTALAATVATFAIVTACASHDAQRRVGAKFVAKSEQVFDFRTVVDTQPRDVSYDHVTLERVTMAAPWPRGLAWVDGELIVLARGRHRRAGGLDPTIPDQCGHLFRVDPGVAEAYARDVRPDDSVRNNGDVLAAPSNPPFHLYDPEVPPIESTHIDRPYCALAFDAASRNLFICGYSGVDLPGKKFRKNATDSIHRYDLRTGKWYPVEMHDAEVVPVDRLSYVTPNEYYPHHDPAANPAPHGLLNGPNAAVVVGDRLYAVGKDNHTLAEYDLAPIRRDADAGPPPARAVLGSTVTVRMPNGALETVDVFGPGALAAHGDYLYVGYRTNSVVLRYSVDGTGALAQPVVGELCAVFEPWDSERKKSANLIDIALNSKGELFVSCASKARIWKVGVPDPSQPFYGDDSGDRPTTAPPYVDIPAIMGKNEGTGNILIDDQDRLYLCSGVYGDDYHSIAGTVFRAVERPVAQPTPSRM